MNGSHTIYQSKDKKTGINVGLVNYKFLANFGLLGLKFGDFILFTCIC